MGPLLPHSWPLPMCRALWAPRDRRLDLTTLLGLKVQFPGTVIRFQNTKSGLTLPFSEYIISVSVSGRNGIIGPRVTLLSEPNKDWTQDRKGLFLRLWICGNDIILEQRKQRPAEPQHCPAHRPETVWMVERTQVGPMGLPSLKSGDVQGLEFRRGGRSTEIKHQALQRASSLECSVEY